MSAVGRARIAPAQRTRRANVKGRKVVSITAHKRRMSPATRRRIVAAQKAALGEMAEGETDSLNDMVTDTQWRALRIELQKDGDRTPTEASHADVELTALDPPRPAPVPGKTLLLSTIPQIPPLGVTWKVTGHFPVRTTRSSSARSPFGSCAPPLLSSQQT
jgi:hypothetical protein